MKTVCARLWQAEAVEDGRLVGGERAAFERHAVDCQECTSKLAALARLRQACAELPAPPDRPFEKRRRREELLARADARQSGRGRETPARGWWPAGLGLVAAAAALVGYLATRPPAVEKLAPVAAPSFQLEPSAGGQWHVVDSGPITRVAVDVGQFDVEVETLGPKQRFLVDLPDGELEVVGTHFVVAADGTTTRSVVVHAGQVILRLEGQSERVIHAGESYTAPEPVEAPVPAATPLKTPQPQLQPPPQPEPEPAVEPTVEPAAAPPPPTAGEELAAAMDAFASGDFGRAETLLAAFEQNHPADSRVEDAAYLRIVARARRGDAAGARQLAREYLQRYPDGFRRREAEGLAAEPPAR